MPLIRAQPRVALADVPVDIEVINLLKEQNVTLRCCVKSDKGRLFLALGWYTANDNGVVKVSTDVCFGGHYVGIEPMGLFWAARVPENEKPCHFGLEKLDIASPRLHILEVFEGHIKEREVANARSIARTTLQRWFKADNVDRIIINTYGIEGVMFVPQGGGQYPGILDISGARARPIHSTASLVASKGFVTLSIQYQPVMEYGRGYYDLEYFEKAIKYLSAHHKVLKAGVGIFGHSLGGTLALFLSAYVPGIACVVSDNGCICSAMNVFYAKYKESWLEPSEWNTSRRQKVGNVNYDIHTTKTPDVTHWRKYVPEFSASSPKLLLLVSQHDGLVNWGEMLSLTKFIFRVCGKKNYKIISYKGAGHLLKPGYTPVVSIRRIGNLESLYYVGGLSNYHAYAQEEYFKEAIEFFKKNITNTSKL